MATESALKKKIKTFEESLKTIENENVIKIVKEDLEKAKKDLKELESKAKKEVKKVEKDIAPKKKPTARKKTTSKKTTRKKQSDIEKAKAELKKKTGKTEEECEKIIEQYKALRSQSNKRRKADKKQSEGNKKRVDKLKKTGKTIKGTGEKTAEAVLETTTAKVKTKLDKELKKPSGKSKVKSITKKLVVDTSGIIKAIKDSLNQNNNPDESKEFLIALRSEIDKLLKKYMDGGSIGADFLQGYEVAQGVKPQANPIKYTPNSSPQEFSEGGSIGDIKDSIAEYISNETDNNFDAYYLDWEEINSVDELEDACTDSDMYYQMGEVIYYSVAMEYLSENDSSLQESLGIASNMGYTVDNLNSEILASLLKGEEMRDDLITAIRSDFVEDAFEKIDELEEDNFDSDEDFAQGGEISKRDKRKKRLENNISFEKEMFEKELSDLKAGKRKTINQYFVQGNYGYGDGFEDLTAHDTRSEAVLEKMVYQENENAPFRVVTKRIRKADYFSGNYAKGGLMLDDLKDSYDINVVEDYSKRNYGKSFNNLTPRQRDEILEEYTEDNFDSDEEYAKGGITKNNQIIEQFLDEKTDNELRNISIHYSTMGDVMLLRNYGTLIAKRKGNKVSISDKKYSVTTSTIQNAIERMAKSRGMKVERINPEKFAEGGKMKQGYNDREDESLGMRTGREKGKKQNYKARREDSYGKWGKRDMEKRDIKLARGGNIDDYVADQIISMLRENTGKHFMDSGGDEGRMWQRNQNKIFAEEPEVDYEIYNGEITETVSTYHYLTEILETDEFSVEVSRYMEELNEEDSDYFYINSMEDEIEETFAIEYVTKDIVNTYNYENNLSQILLYKVFKRLDTDEVYVLLQIHGGADVRGGYTFPRCFKLEGYLTGQVDVYGNIDGVDVTNTYNGYSLTTDEGEEIEVKDNAEVYLEMQVTDDTYMYAKGGRTKNKNWIQNVTKSKDFNKGAFTRKAKSKGMTTKNLMKEVLANKSEYDSTTVKQAQLMKNMM